ncbi:MAG: transporter substrate-binding domain-containing protein [Lachnospiraceae bacterium]|nr:transporter substrate-binding domain-containing protein [Lachnospiraceae bacterium]
MSKIYKIMTVFIMFFVFFLFATSTRVSGFEGVYSSIDELEGKRIGVTQGTFFDVLTKERIPNVEIAYYLTVADLVQALETGKIDGFVVELPMLNEVMKNTDSLTYIEAPLEESEFGVIFPKTDEGKSLENEFSEYIKRIKADGSLKQTEEVWFGTSEKAKELFDYTALPNDNGTLILAVDPNNPPFTYVKNGQVTGFEMAIAAGFCREYGYGMQVQLMDFPGIIPSLETGKSDFSISSFTITEERAESVYFSEPYYTSRAIMAVLKNKSVSGFRTFDELSGKTISMLTGAPFEELISSKVNNVKEFTYFQTMPDMVLAIKSGKTDAGFMNNAVGELAVNKDSELALFPESFGESKFGLAFKKGDVRCGLWQDAYDNISSDVKRELWKKWTGADDSIKVMLKQDWPGENGTVRVAACDALEPMSYVGKDGELMGLDIETILLIAKELDVHVEFIPMDFSGVLSSIGSGKADIGCGSIVTTDERRETMDFVEYQKALYVLIVRSKESTDAGKSFLGGIRESFYKTFIREDRYKLFVEGILTTLIITFLSVIFGTLFGFIIYMLCRKGNRLSDILSRFFVWLIQGMPMVVLLMILYYIIFAKTRVSGIVVAVIAFTLVFGFSVFGMLKMGVGAVDKGQTEASLALGYGSTQLFFKIILPQALPHFLPSYKGEVVSLIKATAIVGYIAVQDLTKMGDIVRGRTYEAFFPLVAVAIIYFVLEGLFTFLVGRIEKTINPKRRKREDILKRIKEGGN